MSHVVIVVQEPGSGPDGSAVSRVEYTPADNLTPAEIMHKVNKARRVMQRLNDFMYGDGPDPYPGT